MSLLQHPLRTLDQIEWYLSSRDKELFPGAFLLSAGNLARQLLEQILFILAFYSGMPRTRFLKSSNRLRTADSILKALKEVDPATGHTYIERARKRGPCIQKLARFPRSLNRYRRIFNETSHFSNPGAGRKFKEDHIRQFVSRFRHILEEVDAHLITAAVNDIRSNGFIRAVLSKDSSNIPGIEYKVVVTPNLITYKDGKFSMRTPRIPIQVVPNSKEVPYRWRKRVVVVQHSIGMALYCQMLTESGEPINISNFQSVVDAFVNNLRDRKRLIRRMKRFGIAVELAEHPLKRKLSHSETSKGD